jgi:streptogramin lyase
MDTAIIAVRHRSLNMAFTLRFRSLTRSFSRFNLISSRFCSAAGTRPRGAESRLRPGLAYLVLILAVLLLSASASAQVTYTGTAATQNFGSQAVGSASAAVTLNFSVAAGTKVGSIGVLTQGAPNLDFNSATGGTCAAQEYSAAATCTVNVTLKPGHPGLRMGAVVFFSEAGNAGISLGQLLIYGTGTGPQVVFSPSPVAGLGGGFSEMYGVDGVAVDAGGNVYVADDATNTVKEMPPGCSSSSCVTVLSGGFSRPGPLAVDGVGNVYVADGSEAKEIPLGCRSSECVISLGGGFAELEGIAVDANGNVYVGDETNNSVYEIPAGCATTSCVKTRGGGFNEPVGVAVDATGNVYVADYGNSAVKKIPASCGSAGCVQTVGGDFSALAVAVDGSGNVYIGDSFHGLLKEMPAGCTSAACVLTIGSSTVTHGMAVDSLGNVYAVSGSFSNSVEEVERAAGPELAFRPTADGQTSGDSPQTVIAQNIGNAPLIFPVPSSGNNPAILGDFSLGSSGPTACPLVESGASSSGTLAAAANCSLSVSFMPAVGDLGSLNGSLTFLDDTLNAEAPAFATQSVALSGEGLPPDTPQQTVDAGSAAVNVNTPLTFTVSLILPTNGTITAPVVMTQGARGLDFTDAGTGTCTTNGTSYSYNAGDTCTVIVNFKPRYAGTRSGAVVLSNPSGFAIATAFVYGTGIGPQVVFSPNLASALGGGFRLPVGVAVDGGGNVFVADYESFEGGEVKEIPLGCTSADCVNVVGGGFDLAGSFSELAVDGAGNVYLADNGNNAVKEIPAGCTSASCVITLGGGFFTPWGVAVDTSGNVYVAASGVADSEVGEVFEMPSGCSSSSCVTQLGGAYDFNIYSSVAVDGSGNVYVGEFYEQAVDKMPPGCNSADCVTKLGGGFGDVSGVALDGSGNVYVDDYGNAVKEMPADCFSSSCVITLGGISSPYGIAVDGGGSVYVVNYGNSSAEMLNRTIPPEVTFPSTVNGQSSAPQTVLVQNIGNANLTFPVPTSGNNPTITSGFTLDASTTCPGLTAGSAAGRLAAGTSCTYAVDFMPTESGNYSGSLTLTDNSLNASPAATQTVQLTGMAVEAHLAFTAAPPANVGAGKVPGTVVVSVEDASNSVVTTSSATITLTVTGPNSYSKMYTASASSGVATFSSLASLNVPGSYSYTATDIPDGLTQAVATETVTAQPPIGELDKIEDSVTLSTTVGQSDSVEIKGWVADQVDGAPMSNVKVYIDGTSIGTPTLGIAVPAVAALRDNNAYLLSGYQMLYPASSLSLGTHQVTVVAIDSLGLSTTFGPISFTVASTAGAGVPFGDLGPAEDSVTFSTTVGQSDSVNIQGWAGDPQDHAPLTNVTVYLDGTSIGAPTLGLARPAVASAYGSPYLNSGYQLLYPASSLSLGTHNVTVIAIDSGGRSTTFGPVTFTVAATAGAGSPFGELGPAVDSVTSSTSISQSDSVKISGWVFDPGNGVAMSSVTAYIDGTSIGTPTMGIARGGVAKTYGSSYFDSGYQMLYPASSLSLGAHAVTVIAIDSGGRSTTFGPVSFTVQ